MTWVGWLIILGGLCVVALVVRGIVEFCRWYYEEFIEPRQWLKKPPKPPAKSAPD